MASKESQKINENEQTLKYFLSNSDEPIPDITHGSDTTIFPHFRFFFNDPQLAIFSLPSHQSVMHDPNFEVQINEIYRNWVQNQEKNEFGQNSAKNGRNSQNDEPKNSKNQTFLNFIAFVEFWVRNTSNIKVVYAPFNQIVKESVQQFMDNQTGLLNAADNRKQFQQKLNSQIQSHLKLKSKKAVSKLSTEEQMEKRLSKYFEHFAQHHKSTAHKPTFDEIKEDCISLDLNQWVAFVKKVCQPENEEDIKNKTANSIKTLKNIFERNCSKNKKMKFSQFKKALSVYFMLLMNLQEEEGFKKGQRIMKLDSEIQFKQKMKSLGVFMSDYVTIIQNPSPLINPKKTGFKINPPQQTKTISCKPKPLLNLQKSLKLSAVKINPTHLYKSSIKKPQDSKNIVSLASLQPTIPKDNERKLMNKLNIGNEENEDPFLKKYFNSSHEHLLQRMDNRIGKIEAKLLR